MNDEVILQPKRPLDRTRWRLYDHIRVHLGFPAERWVSVHGHVAITAVETPEDVGQPPLGPEYHVSISFRGGRVSADEVPALLKDWGMEGADEDNHVQGIARHFWKPVAEKYHGYVCVCKRAEHAITEGDYVWRPQR